jgi:hypothetical protein
MEIFKLLLLVVIGYILYRWSVSDNPKTFDGLKTTFQTVLSSVGAAASGAANDPKVVNPNPGLLPEGTIFLTAPDVKLKHLGCWKFTGADVVIRPGNVTSLADAVSRGYNLFGVTHGNENKNTAMEFKDIPTATRSGESATCGPNGFGGEMFAFNLYQKA